MKVGMKSGQTVTVAEAVATAAAEAAAPRSKRGKGVAVGRTGRHSTGRHSSTVGYYGALVALTALLAASALRLLQPPQSVDSSSAVPVSMTPSVMAADWGGTPPRFTAEEISTRAELLLARLIPGNRPGHRQVQATEGLTSRAAGADQRLWFVMCAVVPPASGGTEEDPEDQVELRYDADTGKLIYVRTTRAVTPGTKTLTARQAIQAARAWLSVLGLAQKEGESAGPPLPPAAVLFPPRRLHRGLWRVWLRGRETPGSSGGNGQALTVQVAVSAFTGDLRYAAVVERVAYPRLYLPHRSSGSP